MRISRKAMLYSLILSLLQNFKTFSATVLMQANNFTDTVVFAVDTSHTMNTFAMKTIEGIYVL